MHEFETCVGPLDVIGVEFRRLGNIGGKWRTLTHDSDHAECLLPSVSDQTRNIAVSVECIGKVIVHTFIVIVQYLEYHGWKT